MTVNAVTIVAKTNTGAAISQKYRKKITRNISGFPFRMTNIQGKMIYFIIFLQKNFSV
jgi:hypothetical protein